MRANEDRVVDRRSANAARTTVHGQISVAMLLDEDAVDGDRDGVVVPDSVLGVANDLVALRHGRLPALGLNVEQIHGEVGSQRRISDEVASNRSRSFHRRRTDQIRVRQALHGEDDALKRREVSTFERPPPLKRLTRDPNTANLSSSNSQ